MKTRGIEKVLVTGGAGFIGSHLVDMLTRVRISHGNACVTTFLWQFVAAATIFFFCCLYHRVAMAVAVITAVIVSGMIQVLLRVLGRRVAGWMAGLGVLF